MRWLSLAMAIVVLTGVMPSGLTAAIDRSEVSSSQLPLRPWTFAQSTSPPAEAVVPPVKRERPAAVPAAPAESAAPQPATEAAAPAPQPEATPQPDTGILGSIQDWLARANREYQGVVVKQLSLPPPGQEDPIAKKLQDQQDEDARKAAAADAARTAAEAKAAADAKAAMAKRLAEDRRRAEETKRLADEAKRKADEILEAAEKQAGDQAGVTAPATDRAVSPEAETTTESPEQQRREAAKLAEEAKRQDALRQAEEARRTEAERRRVDAARLEEERAAAARIKQQPATEARPSPSGTEADMHRRRTIVLVAEPIERPVDRGSVYRPELAAPMDASETASQHQLAGGTAVKRWVARTSGQRCRGAGQRVTPPARYTVQSGDSLWRISKRHYHSGRMHKRIFRANRGSIRNPNLIYPCQRVFVPRKR